MKDNNFVKGVNDLQTVCSQLAKEWDFENNSVNPSDVFFKTYKEVGWICQKGHHYKAIVYDRSVRGRGCPYCAGKKIMPGYNDLASQAPEIAAEWDYEKNGDLKPTDVAKKSNKKVWWKCKKGHEWKARIAARTSYKTGCSVCAREGQTSFPEQAVFFYIKQHFEDAINRDKETIGMELDIYIPSIKTAIEYDSLVWHQNAKSIIKEKHKNELCSQNGIKLIRIREKGLPFYDDCVCFERTDYQTNVSLESAIEKVLACLKIENADVDTDRDSGLILGTYVSKEKANSLAKRFPEIAKEWNYEKNGSLKPTDVTAGSDKKVWFTCSKGHDFQSKISNRTFLHRGCPYCTNQKVLVGFNDLESKFPEIAAEWDYEKNGDLKPTDVVARTHKKVWFKCSNGHSYLASIANRTSPNQNGCPECDSLLKRPVIVCIENGKVYKNSSEAEKDLGFIDARKIVSTRAKNNKVAYGYHWRLATEEEKASIGLISLPPNENIPAEPTPVEEFQLHISSDYKKIQFDSVRADAQNRMLIEKMGQSALALSGSSFLQA